MTTDLFDVSGKTAVVTGGTSGIGSMIAHGLHERGAHVVIAGRKEPALAEARSAGITALQADLSTPEACRELAEQVADEVDRIDILVNNAGATWGAPIEEFPDSAWDRVLDLNVQAPFTLTQALLPQLLAAATEQDPARVIMIGSIDGIRVPQTESYSYSASKAAVHQLTRHLAGHLGSRHITVNAIAPGPFESRMMAHFLAERRDEIEASSPLRRIGRADDMVGTVIYLASRAGSYLTGAVIPVDGGISTTS
ncbi:SDR family oxidoreductase [Gordonia sp. LSe1-13]|uniref:SDR family oxidoreductase n=1 Tax=Gordonia sesuvii TaxID=3116777 RepID=A0ABU7M944_9ACTN|nr:SDR family oxidoreductase [Gordonia sp. LSe1-13]